MEIKDWFKKIKWLGIIDSRGMVFFYPLVVLSLITFVDFTNPLKWFALIGWLVIFWRNYEKTPMK